MDFKSKYNEFLKIFEEYLFEKTQTLNGHTKLVEAMKYSLLSGGKRVRPVLMLATSEILGLEINDVLPFALALECIHTYSLIHDDLPAMDNDDLRRGKPTNHKVFGEDFAILAGDALLNLAMEICLDFAKTEKQIFATKFLFNASGYRGMVGGQALDLCRQFDDDEKQLLETDIKKTSKLISSALVIPAILSGKFLVELESLGEKIGVVYQFVDDILDFEGNQEVLGKAVKKDEAQGKISSVVVYGIEKTKKLVEKMRLQSIELLDKIPSSEFLKIFVNNSTKRVS